MKYTLFSIFLMVGLSGFAQDISVSFEHNALLVEDVKASAAFYREILGLQPIEVPGGDDERRWFSMGSGLQLHLIEGDRSDLGHHRSIHMAFRLQQVDPLVEKLRAASIPFYSWPGEEGVITTRADGVHQIYIRDPDGYWIEINDMGSD
jgi:catechol 2,3-dioxygenase-like lactoylglutathione lyase family enzyme